MTTPSFDPIRPEGLLDGIRWGCVLRGALLDIVLTIVASVPLLLWLVGPEAFSEGEAGGGQAIDDAMASPEGLFWSAVVGLAATVIGAAYGARRAGTLHVRHGGWVAVVSMALGLVSLLVPGAGAPETAPVWFEAFGLAAMLPAGLLGGYLAARLAGDDRDPRPAGRF